VQAEVKKFINDFFRTETDLRHRWISC